MSFNETIELPLNVFWLLNTSIQRIRAEENLRAVTVASATTGTAENYREVRESLMTELGEVMKVDPIETAERDEQGFQELKAIAASMAR